MSHIFNITFPSATGTGNINALKYIPEGEPKGILQIAHGMAEHIMRYADFAKYLNENSIVVVGNDHAGHGGSMKDSSHEGFFASEDGWNLAVEDMHRLYETVSKEYPGLPYILMGHSMGSVMARSYSMRYHNEMDGFIFSGTNGKNPLLPIAKLLAKREIKKHGAKGKSALLNKMSFGSYNKQFKDAKTDYDWLSRDEEQVRLYDDDELCGFVFSAAGYRDLFYGVDETSRKGWAEKVDDKPILLIAGDRDPVGGNGKGVSWVCEQLKSAKKEVYLKLYPDGRHEMLNETNKQEVYGDIMDFIGLVLDRK